MTLARRAGTAIVLETGVYFPRLDLDRPRGAHVVCFHTRAGFRRLTGKSNVTQLEIRELFRIHRKIIERTATALYEVSDYPPLDCLCQQRG